MDYLSNLKAYDWGRTSYEPNKEFSYFLRHGYVQQAEQNLIMVSDVPEISLSDDLMRTDVNVVDIDSAQHMIVANSCH